MSRQRGTTWQADVILRDTRRLRPGGFVSETAANLWEALALDADAKGLPLPPVPTGGRAGTTLTAEATTLGELRKTVLGTAKPDGWKGSKDYRNADERSHMAVQFFGAGKRVSAIDVAEVDRYITALTAMGNSGATINRKVAALSKMLTFARRRAIIQTTPYMARQDAAAGRIRFLTQAEELTILNRLELMGEHDFRQLSIFLIDTGARFSEAYGLTAADLGNGTRATFWITKGGKARTIPLTPRAQAAVKHFDGRNGAAGPFSGMHYWNCRAIWDRCRTKLGAAYDDVVIHTFRHTCASRFVMEGRDLLRVMKWMGHQSFKTTLGYAHLSPDALDEMLVSKRSQSAEEQNATNVTALVPKRATE